MEYGLAPCLPNYSGGLGILAGDHLKAASDLGLPLTGIGLLYQEGYFQQFLNADGWQQESYPVNDFFNLPLKLEHDKNGDVLKINVFGHDELTTVARVSGDGSIKFPLIGQIDVGSLTLLQISDKISKLLSDGYVVDPQVSIFVQEFRSKKAFIMGEVNKPGFHVLSGNPGGGPAPVQARVQAGLVLGRDGISALILIDFMAGGADTGAQPGDADTSSSGATLLRF